jgi:hypothetical protein
MIAYDLIPKQLNEIEALQYPHNDNARVLVKRRIREAANRDLPLNEQCNVLHASDNSSESLEYIGLLSPSTINDIRGQVTRLHEKFRTRRRVVRSLTGSGRRAKIELVEYNGKLAVQKTFRPGAEKYLLREKFALEKLSVGCPYIPKLIESGNNYVVMPYYGQKVSTRLGLLSLNSVQAVFETMRYLYSKDYFWGDANPNNLRLDDNGNIKLIDYEFLQEYRERPATFSESYDLVLLPLDFQYDLPGLRLRKDGGGYSDLWKPYTGLDLDDVLHASRWKQHLKRAWYRVSLLPLSALLKTTTRLYVRVRKIFILTFGKFVQSSLDIAVDRILSRLLI